MRGFIVRRTEELARSLSHTEADIDKIAASIVEFGWTMPVLVDEKGRTQSPVARPAEHAGH
jgi:ParB-like chromosome segregation protein Spo0J